MGGRERAWVTGDQACSVGRSPGHPQPGQRLPGLQPRGMGPPTPPTITRGSMALTSSTPARQVPASVTVASHLPSVTPPFTPTHYVTDMPL